jgi:prepilin-type N-terminal cleavage/methylation domain-containing protein
MRPPRRNGFTILELMAVLAILVIIGAVAVPTISNYFSNTRQKATADILQGRIREARAKAMETGIWYRLAISSDKKKLRLAPDCQNFDSLTKGNPDAPFAQVIEESFEEGVTAEVVSSDASQSSNAVLQQESGTPESSSSQQASSGSWTTVMTFGPEGICREGLVTVSVKEAKFLPITIQIRGIVGTSSIVPTPKDGGGK